MERGSRWRTFPRPLFDSSPGGHLPSPDLSSSRPLRRQHLVPALTTDPGPVDQPPRRRRLVLPRGGGGSSFLGGLAEPAEPRPRGDRWIRTLLHASLCDPMAAQVHESPLSEFNTFSAPRTHLRKHRACWIVSRSRGATYQLRRRGEGRNRTGNKRMRPLAGFMSAALPLSYFPLAGPLPQRHG